MNHILERKGYGYTGPLATALAAAVWPIRHTLSGSPEWNINSMVLLGTVLAGWVTLAAAMFFSARVEVVVDDDEITVVQYTGWWPKSTEKAVKIKDIATMVIDLSDSAGRSRQNTIVIGINNGDKILINGLSAAAARRIERLIKWQRRV